MSCDLTLCSPSRDQVLADSGPFPNICPLPNFTSATPVLHYVTSSKYTTLGISTHHKPAWILNWLSHSPCVCFNRDKASRPAQPQLMCAGTLRSFRKQCTSTSPSSRKSATLASWVATKKRSRCSPNKELPTSSVLTFLSFCFGGHQEEGQVLPTSPVLTFLSFRFGGHQEQPPQFSCADIPFILFRRVPRRETGAPRLLLH